MAFELDHLFVWTSVGAPEGDQLVEFGLTEGSPNAHPGQGTACRRFFFSNAYLELLWVHHAAEAQSDAVSPLHLWERWSGRADGTCPFGFIFRPGAPSGNNPPFHAREYRPPYFRPPASIRVATNAHLLTEPMLFHLPFARRPDGYSADQRPALKHAAGFYEVSRVEMVGPGLTNVSAELNAVIEAGLVRARKGTEYLLEVEFDGGKQGRRVDFQPLMPLVFRW